METLKSSCTSATTSSLTAAQLTELKDQCVLADPNRNAIWLDANDVPLMQYLPNFITEPLATALEEELDRLVTAAPPKLPVNKSRYNGFVSSKLQASFPTNTPCGELRLVIYNQQGHNDRPGPAADLAGTCYRTEAALHFRTSNPVTALSEKLSQTLAAVDMDAWNLARGLLIAAKREWSTLGAAEKGADACFSGIFILVNTFTDIHLDLNDVIDSWTIMTVLGHFTDSHLYVPDLNARLPHRRRHVVLLRSHILRHFSEQFQIIGGTGRYVLIHTNNQKVFEYLKQHYKLVYV